MTIPRSALMWILLLATGAVVRGNDVELERAIRQVRMKVYQSFRLNRTEFDRRMEFLEQTLQRWSGDALATGDRQELLRWLESLRDQPHLIGQTLPQRVAPRVVDAPSPVESKPRPLPPTNDRPAHRAAPTDAAQQRPDVVKTPRTPRLAAARVPSLSKTTPPPTSRTSPSQSTLEPQPNKSVEFPATAVPLDSAPSHASSVTHMPLDPRRVEPRGSREPAGGKRTPSPHVPSRRTIDASPSKVAEGSPRMERRPGELPVVPAPNKIATEVLEVHVPSPPIKSAVEHGGPNDSGRDDASVNVERLAARIRSYHLNRAALAEELAQLPAESLDTLLRWTKQFQQLRDELQFISLYYDAVPPRLRQQIESPRPLHEFIRQLERRRLERWEAIQARNERRDDPRLAHELEALSGLADEYARWSHE